jgi:hypothetical protein
MLLTNVNWLYLHNHLGQLREFTLTTLLEKSVNVVALQANTQTNLSYIG